MEDNKDFKKLEEYFKKAKSNKIEFKGFCHDCNKPVSIDIDVAEDGKLTIEGGAVYFPDLGTDSEENTFFVKCEKCFGEDATLRNYQPVKCYSRVVGFYTDINQWNAGKQSEWAKRKDYELPNNAELNDHSNYECTI